PSLEDFADLLPLQVRHLLHLFQLALPLRQVMVAAGHRGSVGDRPHRDRFREGRREASGEDDRERVGQVSRRHRDPEDDPEDVDESVLTAEDEVREEARVRAAIEALRAQASPIEVVRFAGRGFASSYDGASGVAPRGLVALSSAANLLPFLQAQFHPLPILQAVAFVASEKKAKAPPKPPLAVSGEISHLGRSFLFAARAGERREAESVFLGMLPEGRQRKTAGAIVVRTAIEDMGEGGRKLMIAVKSWQLARAVGFKEARVW